MSAKVGFDGRMAVAAGSSRKRGRERIPDERELDIPERTVTDILARLSRAEGQVRAVKRMITERRDCHVIAHQMAAANAALSRAAAQLMTASMAQCLSGGAPDDVELARLTEAFAKLLG